MAHVMYWQLELHCDTALSTRYQIIVSNPIVQIQSSIHFLFIDKLIELKALK